MIILRDRKELKRCKRSGIRHKSKNNGLIKTQVTKIQKSEKKRNVSIQKFQNLEKAKDKKIRMDHRRFVEKCQLKEANRKLKERERYLKLK